MFFFWGLYLLSRQFSWLYLSALWLVPLALVQSEVITQRKRIPPKKISLQQKKYGNSNTFD